MLSMEPKFTKYKKLIELQLEELTADNALGQSAQKTVELDQLVGWKAFTHGRPAIPSYGASAAEKKGFPQGITSSSTATAEGGRVRLLPRVWG